MEFKAEIEIADSEKMAKRAIAYVDAMRALEEQKEEKNEEA